MPKIAIITGSGFNKKFLKGFSQKIIKTMYGNVLLFEKSKVIILPRHGKNNNIPPPKVNHKANICALNLEGVEKIFGLYSVGSVKESIKPGAIIIPDDDVNFNPKSFFEFELKCIIPEISADLIKEMKQVTKKLKIASKNKGTYVQTKGPRFETKAEIKIIKKWGDVVGMTMATESTLIQELGLPHSAVCCVDNYAHGIGKKKLTIEEMEKVRKKTIAKLEKIAREIIRRNKK